jgi:hypothetical protein
MANPALGGVGDFNATTIEEFRANGGRVGGFLAGTPAEELDDAARAELWPKLIAESPSVGDYQARATRQFPVSMLTRRD